MRIKKLLKKMNYWFAGFDLLLSGFILGAMTMIMEDKARYFVADMYKYFIFHNQAIVIAVLVYISIRVLLYAIITRLQIRAENLQEKIQAQYDDQQLENGEDEFQSYY